MTGYEQVGTMDITSGSAVIGDPSIDIYNKYCANVSLANGTYTCWLKKEEMDKFGVRPSSMMIILESSKYTPEKINNMSLVSNLEKRSLLIGIDTGICGIYDKDWFLQNQVHDLVDICKRDYQIFDYAFISTSGIGDGVYDLYTYENNVALMVDFYNERAKEIAASFW